MLVTVGQYVLFSFRRLPQSHEESLGQYVKTGHDLVLPN
jgi:hypothetical protein